MIRARAPDEAGLLARRLRARPFRPHVHRRLRSRTRTTRTLSNRRSRPHHSLNARRIRLRQIQPSLNRPLNPPRTRHIPTSRIDLPKQLTRHPQLQTLRLSHTGSVRHTPDRTSTATPFSSSVQEPEPNDVSGSSGIEGVPRPPGGHRVRLWAVAGGPGFTHAWVQLTCLVCAQGGNTQGDMWLYSVECVLSRGQEQATGPVSPHAAETRSRARLRCPTLTGERGFGVVLRRCSR